MSARPCHATVGRLQSSSRSGTGRDRNLGNPWHQRTGLLWPPLDGIEELPSFSPPAHRAQPEVAKKPAPPPPAPAGGSAAAAHPAVRQESRAATSTAGARVKASPLAKKIAAAKKVNLSNLSGTGPGGRIVARDVE